MKHFLLIAGAAALSAGCASVEDSVAPEPMAAEPMAAEPMAAASAGMPALAYVENAASGDLFEIESSRLALSMSRNPEIRSFAQMLISDHTRLTQQVAAAARADGLSPPPPRLLPHHAAALQRLQAAGMAGFDTAFKNEQITAHQEALNLHGSYAQGGDRPALRSAASQAVPAIEAHLARAQALPDYVPAPAPQGRNRAGERG
jgi:putative membrane protein